MNNQLCVYDGITALNMDPVSIDHILSHISKYRLKASYDLESKIQLGQSGRYKNIDLQTGANKRGSGIYLGGSLHKWKNGNHNYDQFYWEEFDQVVQEWKTEFKFDSAKVDSCGLEAGVNIIVPSSWNYSATEIAENILLLKGKPREKYLNYYGNAGFGFEVFKGECEYKCYDKGRQYKTGFEILRVEKRYLKGRTLAKFGIRTLTDLLNPECHRLICLDLLKSFEDMLIFQPELLNNPRLTMEEKNFVITFNNSNAWLTQLKESNYQFKKYKALYHSLVNNYCEYNIKEELLKTMGSMIA